MLKAGANYISLHSVLMCDLRQVEQPSETKLHTKFSSFGKRHYGHYCFQMAPKMNHSRLSHIWTVT